MPHRYFSFFVSVLATVLFAADARSQQNFQPTHSPQAWVQPASQQLQQQPAGSLPQSQVNQGLPPVYEPAQMLDAKLNTMQSQLESLGNCESENSCESCGNECDSRANECEQCGKTFGGGFFVQAGVVFSKPHFKEAFQHSQTNFATGQQTLVPFSYDYDPTPLISLGYKRADGLGMKVSYWNYDAEGQTSTNVADGINIYGAHAISIIFPANIFALLPGETLVDSDSLKTQIQNYYLTFDKSIAKIDVSGGMGLRYVRLEQSLNSVVLDQAGAPIRQLSWQRNFNGLGPAITLDAKRRLGQSPISLFATGGGSLLFGTKTLDRTVLGDQSPHPTTPFLTLDDADEVVGVGEMGIGVELSRQLACGHYATVRGQYEGQLWAEGGAPTLGFLGFEGFGVLFELSR